MNTLRKLFVLSGLLTFPICPSYGSDFIQRESHAKFESGLDITSLSLIGKQVSTLGINVLLPHPPTNFSIGFFSDVLGQKINFNNLDGEQVKLNYFDYGIRTDYKIFQSDAVYIHPQFEIGRGTLEYHPSSGGKLKSTLFNIIKPKILISTPVSTTTSISVSAFYQISMGLDGFGLSDHDASGLGFSMGLNIWR